MEALPILGSVFLFGALIGLPEAIERWKAPLLPKPKLYSFSMRTKDMRRMIFVEDSNLEDAWVTALEIAGRERPGEMIAVGPKPWPQ